MSDEPHDVVKLLVSRMQSHPEEFKRSLSSRWYDTVDEINAWGNEADKAAINAKLRDIRLDEAHEDALEELLNGPERRRREAEEAKYEQQLIWQQAQKSQQMAAQQYAQQYQNAAGAFTPGFPVTPLSGASAAGTWLDETYNTNKTKLSTSTIDSIKDFLANGKK